MTYYRHHEYQSLARRRRRWPWIVAILAAAVVLGGAGGSALVMLAGPDDPAGGAGGPAVQAPPATTSPTAPGSLGPCDQLAGTPTEQVATVSICENGTNLQIFATASYDCPDGRRLYWNDLGWGWSDGDWRAHQRSDGQLVPPDAAFADCPQ